MFPLLFTCLLLLDYPINVPSAAPSHEFVEPGFGTSIDGHLVILANSGPQNGQSSPMDTLHFYNTEGIPLGHYQVTEPGFWVANFSYVPEFEAFVVCLFNRSQESRSKMVLPSGDVLGDVLDYTNPVHPKLVYFRKIYSIGDRLIAHRSTSRRTLHTRYFQEVAFVREGSDFEVITLNSPFNQLTYDARTRQGKILGMVQETWFLQTSKGKRQNTFSIVEAGRGTISRFALSQNQKRVLDSSLDLKIPHFKPPEPGELTDFTSPEDITRLVGAYLSSKGLVLGVKTPSDNGPVLHLTLTDDDGSFLSNTRPIAMNDAYLMGVIDDQIYVFRDLKKRRLDVLSIFDLVID